VIPDDVVGLTWHVIKATCTAVTTAANEVAATARAQRAPHVLIPTTLIKGRGYWIAMNAPPNAKLILGDVRARGTTPAEACAAFDKAWNTETAD
jgi:hypothetical protein